MSIDLIIGIGIGLVLAAGVFLFQVKFRKDKVNDFIADYEKRIKDVDDVLKAVRGEK